MDTTGELIRSPAGRTPVDRELYLPQVWVNDRGRCAQAGVPAVGFATKPELAIRTLTRALDARVPAGWVTADEVYGQHDGLRAFPAERRMPYVLAIPTSQRLWADTDHRPAQLRARTGSPPRCPPRPGNGSPPAPGPRAPPRLLLCPDDPPAAPRRGRVLAARPP